MISFMSSHLLRIYCGHLAEAFVDFLLNQRNAYVPECVVAHLI